MTNELQERDKKDNPSCHDFKNVVQTKIVMEKIVKKNYRNLGYLFAVFGVFFGSARAFAQSACSPNLPQDVCSLEERIYNNLDFKNKDDLRSVMVGLKGLLVNHASDSLVVQDHILGLVDQVVEEAHQVRAPQNILNQAKGKPNLFGIYDQLKSYWAKNGPIVPLDWSLPEEFRYFVVEPLRRYYSETGKTRFQLTLFSWLSDVQLVEQVQIIRYPNEVILDRQAGIGSWGGHSDQDSKDGQISANTSYTDTPPRDGLYLINVKVKDKPMVNGWFVLSRTALSSTPVVQSPMPNEVYHTATPTFNWSDFRSSESRPFESRKRVLAIYDHVEGSDKDWGVAETDPDSSQSATVNSTGGASSLKEGGYDFNIRFEERWFFGGLLLGRQMQTTVPFSVAK
jgi:hypothetical protein